MGKLINSSRCWCNGNTRHVTGPKRATNHGIRNYNVHNNLELKSGQTLFWGLGPMDFTRVWLYARARYLPHLSARYQVPHCMWAGDHPESRGVAWIKTPHIDRPYFQGYSTNRHYSQCSWFVSVHSQHSYLASFVLLSQNRNIFRNRAGATCRECKRHRDKAYSQYI